MDQKNAKRNHKRCHAYRLNANPHLEAYAGYFVPDREDNPTQPPDQQYCYRCLDGAEPRLNESNVCLCVRNSVCLQCSQINIAPKLRPLTFNKSVSDWTR